MKRLPGSGRVIVTGVEVEHRPRIARVAVHADDGLLVEGRRLAVVAELSEPAKLDHTSKSQIALGASKVLDGYRDCHATWGHGGPTLRADAFKRRLLPPAVKGLGLRPVEAQHHKKRARSAPAAN
jgi:hypothetical protein